MSSGAGLREVDSDAVPHPVGQVPAASPATITMAGVRLEPLPCGDALALFRRLFSHSGEAALLTRPSGEFLAANAAACAVFGASEDTLLGRSREDGHRTFADPGDPRLAAAIEARARDGSARAEMRLRRFNGELFDADVSSVLFLDEGGEATSLLTVRDISAQRSAEREVRTLEQRLGFALDSAAIGDWDMDLRTNVAYRSLRHDQCFGYTEAVPTWGYDTFLAHVHVDDRERVDAAYRHAMSGGSEYDTEFRTLWPDGSLHWLWTKGRFYFDDAGAPCRVAGIVTDISARRSAAEAHEALRAQTERHERMLMSALNAMHDFAHIYDRDGRFVFVNRPLLDLWQTDIEQVLGRNFVELGYPSELAARLQAQLKEVVATRCSVTGEASYTGTAGELGWYEYIFSPVLGPNGDVEFVVGSSRDITERVRNMQALEASAAEFRILAESMPQIVWVARPDGWHVHFNQHWMDYTGLSLEASLGHGWNPPLHPEDRERAAARWRQATESGEPYEIEYRLRRADGVYHWMLGRALPLRDGTGRIVKWFGTCTDIDELKQAQLHVAASNRALLDSEQRYRSLFEQNMDGVYSLDRRGHVVAANAAYLRLIGYAADEIVSTDSLRFVAPECRALSAAHIQQALSGEAVCFQSAKVHRDGRRIEVDVNYQPLLVDGAIAGVHGIVRDITAERRAQDAIRTQAHMLDSIGQAVIATDLFGVVTYLNRFAERLYGWPSAEAVGRRVLDLLVPEMTWSEAADIRARLLDGEGFRGEFRVRRRDGGEFAAAVTVALLRDGNNAVVGRIGVSEDVSERHRVQEALRRQNALLENAQRVAAMGVWEIDLPTNHLVWSAETHRIFGISPAAFDNTFEGFMALVHPDDVGWMRARNEAPAAGGGWLESEYRICRPDGEVRVVFERGEIICDAAGRPLRKSGVVMDVTERRREQDALRELNAGLEARVAARTAELDQANRALAIEVAERTSMLAEVKRSEARFRALTTLSVDWFWEQDADLRFVQIASGDSDLGGLPNGAHVGAQRWELPYTEIAGGDWAPHRALLAAHQPFRDLLLRRVLPEGERFVLVSGTPHHAPDGSFAGYLGIARDVTQAKRAELELMAARDAADAANRAKSEFLAAMSHEIRTPMNGVIGMLDVLQQAGLSGEQAEIVDVIRESAFGLLAIIEDILDFSKIEAGKMEVEHQPLQLAEIVEKACAMLAPTAARAQVRLTVFVDPAIPDSMLGDAGRLRQVLLNLLSNAIKFSGGREIRGRVAVRARLVERLPGCASIEVSVADNGIGIDTATLARLFRPFAQADSSTTRRFGGTGLGLAISKALVELMAGQIDVRSEPSAGSTFTLRLTLPTHDGAVAADDGRNRVRGLQCRIVGSDQPLGADLAAYLVDAGVAVEAAPDLASAGAALPQPGAWTWLVLPDLGATDMAQLRALASSASSAPTCFVLLSHGARRRPRLIAPDLVTVDADALRRRTLFAALALANDGARAAAANEVAVPAPPISMPPASVALQAPGHAEHRPQRRLVLVVDDNAVNRTVIVRQLQLLGVAAEVCADGGEALQRWRSGMFALLLTDLHMPGINGYELAVTIRGEEAPGQRTPIVALTANALLADQRRCLAGGIDACLTKPVPLTLLKETVDAWLDPARAAALRRSAEGGPPSTGVDGSVSPP